MTITPADIAWNDQYQAAEADAHQWTRDHGPMRIFLPEEDPWLPATIRAFLDACEQQPIRSCPHLDGAPQLIHAALWCPGTLVCRSCVSMLVLDDPDADQTCDRCGQHTDMPALVTVCAGPVLLSYGLCAPCTTRTYSTTVPDPEAQQ